MEFELTELAHGIHRIETVVGERIHAYHAFETGSGVALADTGFAGATEDLFEPALEELGYGLPDVSLVVVTHADADHHGGNAELRERVPGVTVAAHEADAAMVESVDRLMKDRYRQFEADHDIGYGDELLGDLRGMVSGDASVDLRFRSGVSIGIEERALRILHTPGHTPGHVMLYDSDSGVLVGGDGFFGRGIDDIDGNPTQPPPYHLYEGYTDTLQLVDALAVETLSFTHYPLLHGDEIDDMIGESERFVSDVDAVLDDLLSERDAITVQEAIDETVDRLGSFGLDLDLAYPLSAHLEHRRKTGDVSRDDDITPVEYQQT